MTKWYRFAHMKSNYVKKGDHVKKGQLIGTIGNADGWYKNKSHVHFDISLKEVIRDYVLGWSKDRVNEQYLDPKEDGEDENYDENDIIDFDHYGYEYLSKIRNKNNTVIGYHTGWDLNGKGAGDSDYGNKIYSPIDGVVSYEYRSWWASSWGNLIVIKKDDKCLHCPIHCPK